MHGSTSGLRCELGTEGREETLLNEGGSLEQRSASGTIFPRRHDRIERELVLLRHRAAIEKNRNVGISRCPSNIDRSRARNRRARGFELFFEFALTFDRGRQLSPKALGLD